MHHPRPWFFVAASIVATSTLCLAKDAEPEREVIKGRDGSEIEVEYGFVDVPENRSDPDTRTISLAYMRVRSPLDEPGTPVFPLAGGPGGSSIDMVKQHLVGGGEFYLALLGGDVVAIDQRGVGRSRPNLTTDTSFDLSLEDPGDEQEMLRVMRDVCREEASRWREQGVDLRGYTTVESADDIDAVRRALGLNKISLWGQSYGTHLALATIRRHGEHVDRAVLVGPEGPDHTMKLPSQTQAGLERIGALVAADEELSKQIPDFMALVEEVLGLFEDGPIFVDVNGMRVGISRFDVQRELAYAIGTTRKSADQVPATLKSLADGDLEAYAMQMVRYRREARIYSAMQMVMDCASGASAARRERIAEEASDCLLGDEVNFPFDGLAEAWGAPDVGDAFRGPLVSDVPVLFIAGDVDSRTPVSNATELMKHLPNARLIVVENAGHDLNWVQTELREAWSAFLAGEEIDVTRVVAPPIAFRFPY